jgi:arylsulfatase
MYSTDNGAEVMTWPDGGTTPFRGEKDTNWEGGWRVPCLIRWPGHIEPGTVSNKVFSHQDMLPTLVAIAGDPDIVEKARRGVTVGDKTFKVHLDGFNLLPFLDGEIAENPRPGFIYWSDDGDLMALRYGNWKMHFLQQRAHGLGVWEEPLVATRAPTFFNLRSNPFEIDSEDAAVFFNKEKVDRVFLILPAVALVSQYLQTFEDFPPRQRPASFSVDQALEQAHRHEEQMQAAAGGR